MRSQRAFGEALRRHRERSGVTIACHTFGLAGGSSGAAGLFARLFRSAPDPAPAETPREPA